MVSELPKNRKQFVNVNDHNSVHRNIDKGVPQGSILGPLLFLIYINDIATCTTLFTLLFADDTSFLISGNSINEIVPVLNRELHKICYWFRANELSLHPLKTKVMIFTRNENNIEFEDLNIVLNYNNYDENNPDLITKLGFINSSSEIPAIKFLGVYLDPKLDFKYHISTIHKKISNSLYAIQIAKNHLNKDALKILYDSLIHCHINYCLPIWSCTSHTNLDKLFKLQKKAIRLITKSRFDAHTIPIFKKEEILPIYKQAEFSKIIFMHDYIKDLTPISFKDTWIRNAQRNSRSLRNDNDLYVPYIRCKTRDIFPLKDFPSLWNEKGKNPQLTDCRTKKQFSSKLKNLLLEELEFNCSRDNCTECNIH